MSRQTPMNILDLIFLIKVHGKGVLLIMVSRGRNYNDKLMSNHVTRITCTKTVQYCNRNTNSIFYCLVKSTYVFFLTLTLITTNYCSGTFLALHTVKASIFFGGTHIRQLLFIQTKINVTIG